MLTKFLWIGDSETEVLFNKKDRSSKYALCCHLYFVQGTQHPDGNLAFVLDDLIYVVFFLCSVFVFFFPELGCKN